MRLRKRVLVHVRKISNGQRQPLGSQSLRRGRCRHECRMQSLQVLRLRIWPLYLAHPASRAQVATAQRLTNPGSAVVV